MTFTRRNRAATTAIVGCHETGRPIGDYSKAVVLKDGAGITYGAHQGTHKSGTLYKIVKFYCDLSNSPVSKQLEAYLPVLANPALRFKAATDKKLLSLLRMAGSEHLMCYAQDRIFERDYLLPAISICEGSNFEEPLSLAVIYDSLIHGSFARIRDKVPPAPEREWIKRYIATRRKWLATHKTPILRKTVYRMDTFQNLIAKGNWTLEPPFVVNGLKITESILEKIESYQVTNDIRSATLEIDADFAENSPNEDSFDLEGMSQQNTEGIASESIFTPEEVPQGGVEGSWEENSVDSTEPTEREGEPVPDAPAKNDEAVLGGRPKDPSVAIPTEKIPTWGSIKAWRTSLGTGTGGGLFSITTLYALWDKIQANPLLILIPVSGILLLALAYCLFMIRRMKLDSEYQAQRHERLLEQLKIHADPTKYNRIVEEN